MVEKTPEWEIFRRVEGLEEIGLEFMEKISKLEELPIGELNRTAKDGLALGLAASLLSLLNLISEGKLKGKKEATLLMTSNYFELTKLLGLSEETQKKLENFVSKRLEWAK